MDTRPPSRRGWRRLCSITGVMVIVAAGAIGLTRSAYAATLFSDNFESGSASGWSRSGGTWAVVTDGSRIFQQSNGSSENARQFNGSSGWTNYAVQARVRPQSLGSGGSVSLLARAAGSTRFYRLALLAGNQMQLQAVNGSSVTVIASATRTVSTGTWYTLVIEVNGTTIRGSVNGSVVGQGTSTLVSTGRIGLQTIFSAASFDDVVVTDGGTPPTIPPSSTTRPPTPTTQPPTATTRPPTTTVTTPPQTGLVGWATQGGGTTGGAGGSTVTVTSLAALNSAVSSTAPMIVRVSGNFTCNGDVRVASNKTILGVGSTSGLTGCGLNMSDVSNVIVRNMRISFVPASSGNGDAIHVDNATRLWIDHNELFSDTNNGTDFYDGLLDMTHAADFITVSWNHLHDHIKCSLVGHSDNNASEDAGHLRITYHHNRFDGCDSRNPRVRFGNPVHVYNNYYNNIGDYGIASTMSGGVIVEGNYFENTEDPFHLGEGSSDPGTLVARNNVFVNSGAGQAGGSVNSVPYQFQLEPASNVRASVLAGAGTGRIGT
jgi:pectate lyase